MSTSGLCGYREPADTALGVEPRSSLVLVGRAKQLETALPCPSDVKEFREVPYKSSWVCMEVEYLREND